MSSRVLLVDTDSLIPNLALMKISAYHKSIGDQVGFDINDPDKVYASVIFKHNKHKVDGLKFYYPNAEIDIGGSGYDLKKCLPAEIDRMQPDYDLYPKCDYYLGFTSRGCIRHCPFCIVPIKEGNYKTVCHVSEICHGENFTKCVLMDNNILADKDHFLETAYWLIDNNISVDFNQGLDARLFDQEVVDVLASLRAFRTWRIAFDSMDYKEDVLRAILMMEAAGISLKHDVMCYVYCDSDDDVEDAVNRCRILKENGVTAYAMLNIDTPITPRMQRLKNWTIPQCFWSCDYDEVDEKTRNKIRNKKSKTCMYKPTSESLEAAL